MFRFISVLLLLVVCFLVGAIVGIDYTGNGDTILPVKTEAQEASAPVKKTANEQPSKTESVNKQTVAEELSHTNENHLSQKTASFLETIVKGFYDVIVEILYSVSQLFF
jgi:predicted PurR-regulated permease PerM